MRTPHLPLLTVPKTAVSYFIAANAANVNLRTFANGQGYPGAGDVIITINAGVEVYSTSTGVAALVPGTWPANVTLIIKGFVDGMGGTGGTYAVVLATAGGPALDARAFSGGAFRVDNSAGQIRGGGGGGGDGGNVQYSDGTNLYTGGGGGGGGGQGQLGGAAGPGAASTSNNLPNGGDGVGGSPSGPGGGGAGGGASGFNGYPGASGGAWGQPGVNGFADAGPRPGGAGGNAVLGNANIVWLANGTRLGAIA
jgi:hypothetical protein